MRIRQSGGEQGEKHSKQREQQVGKGLAVQGTFTVEAGAHGIKEK